MSQFIMTPTNVDLLESLFRDPITGIWSIPILTFNTKYINPYYDQVDPLNEDPNYRKSVIDYFYLRLKEEWLFEEPIFRSLLKYFIVKEDNNEGTITLIDDPDKASSSTINEKYKKHIYKYIEKYFINKHFIKKILKQYVATTHIKWYDLFHNTDTLIELFAHKLKKLIIATIYELQEHKATKTDSQSRVNDLDLEFDDWSDTE